MADAAASTRRPARRIQQTGVKSSVFPYSTFRPHAAGCVPSGRPPGARAHSPHNQILRRGPDPLEEYELGRNHARRTMRLKDRRYYSLDGTFDAVAAARTPRGREKFIFRPDLDDSAARWLSPGELGLNRHRMPAPSPLPCRRVSRSCRSSRNSRERAGRAGAHRCQKGHNRAHPRGRGGPATPQRPGALARRTASLVPPDAPVVGAFHGAWGRRRGWIPSRHLCRTQRATS